jgi:hypothetical protein
VNQGRADRIVVTIRFVFGACIDRSCFGLNQPAVKSIGLDVVPR